MRLPLSYLLLGALWLCTPVLGATLNLQLSDQDGNPVDDAVMYIVSIDGKKQSTSPHNVEIDQVNEAFVPHVRATTINSQVSFPNSDHIRHHIYSFSEAKTFEVPLYIGVPSEPTQFDKPGIVTLGCNIHDHMLGYVLILDTPWYSEVMGGKGVINDIPAGELAIEIWHPRFEDNMLIHKTLQIAADSDEQLALQVVVRPARMVRRAPKRSGTRY